MNKKIITIPAALLMVLANQSQAQITPASSTFDAAGSGITGWTYFGGLGGNLNNPTVANDVDTKDWLNTSGNPLDGNGIVGDLLGDNEALFGPTHGGDLGAGDGGLRLTRFQNTTAGDEWAAFDAVGTIALGEQYSFSGWLYNNSASFYNYSLALYASDGSFLADSGILAVSGTTAADYVPKYTSVSYTATAGDVGKGLQLRLIEQNLLTGGGKNPVMDNFSLTVSAVPEPSSMALAVVGGFGLLALRSRRSKA